MRLFIVRHGETAWNLEGKFQGQIDTDLNETGIRQAKLLANRLTSRSFDSIITSPLKRALNTAQIVKESATSKEMIIDRSIIEINHGLWEGCLADEVRANWGELLEKWHETPETVTMPGTGGESLDDVMNRSVDFVKKLSVNYDGDVLIVTHDAVIKTLLCYWTNTPLSSFWRFQIPNCSISIVEVIKSNNKNIPRLILMGDIAHLGDPFNRQEQKGL